MACPGFPFLSFGVLLPVFSGEVHNEFQEEINMKINTRLLRLFCLAGAASLFPAFPLHAADDMIFGQPLFYGGTNDFATVTGDFDNDGSLDIVTSSPVRRDGFGQIIELGSLAIYNYDPGVGFYLPTEITDQVGGSALAAADLNGDGNLDIVSVNETLVLFGNGDGTFAAPVSYGTPSTDALAVALGDMDNDGDIDIVRPNNDRILLNNGDGTFFTNFVGSNVSGGGSVALGDIDEDGNLDIATAYNFYNEARHEVSLQLGTGNGNGDPGQPYNVDVGGNSPAKVALQDMNNDGHLDLISLNQASNDISVLPGAGDGTFGTPFTIRTHPSGNILPNVMTVADVNNDGNMDVVVTSTVYGNATSHQETSIMIGDGSGSLMITQIVERFGQLGENIVAADLDGDGDTDLATSSHILYNQNQGGSSCPEDLNGDGQIDQADLGQLLAAYNTNDGGDIDGDGDTDQADLGQLLAAYGQTCS